jgi:hypothetical protein
MRLLPLPVGCLLLGATSLSAQAPSTTTLIEGALLAAPDSLRAGAAVLAANGEVLRRGTNSLICLADDPATDRFQVACYHRDLEPFMARGRALKGMKREQVDSIRREEIRAGKWSMPRAPTALYNFAAPKDSLDAATGLPRGGARWYVVYIPGATEASTGLSLQPDGSGRPWLMYPGEPWAHVMVTPR